MRILRMLRTKDSLDALPAVEQAEVMKKALGLVDKHTRTGRLGEVYFTPEMNLVVVMWDMESPEEMAQISSGYSRTYDTQNGPYHLGEYDAARKMQNYALAAQMDMSLEAAGGAV